jgi:hypothetical protein
VHPSWLLECRLAEGGEEFVGGRRWELHDLHRPASTDQADFRIRTPPSARVEQETGPLDEAPEPLRQVVRTAEQIGRVVGPAASRAADVLGSLLSRGRR